MIRVLGMMSGTSMDGVDAAMIETDGVRIGGFGRIAFRAYSDNESAALHGALGRWPGEAGVADAAAISVASHAAMAADFPEAELIGYHGQTLAHDPQGRGTHQAGDGALLARKADRPVVWDFRSEDVRRGGEGAPLAPFFHWACAGWAVGQGKLSAQPVAFLNLGGVGNITWVDPTAPAPEVPGACLAFDTGPANAPIDDLMRRRLRRSHDADGALAAAGRADGAVVADFLAHPWFDRPPPKSLVCGGGRRNPAIMARLAAALPCAVQPVEAAGLDGDMLEAQAFGWLAARVMRGWPTSGPTTTGVPAPCCGGRISHPRKRQDFSKRALDGGDVSA